MSESNLKAPTLAGELGAATFEAVADAIICVSSRHGAFPGCSARGDHRLDVVFQHGPEKTLNVSSHFALRSTNNSLINLKTGFDRVVTL